VLCGKLIKGQKMEREVNRYLCCPVEERIKGIEQNRAEQNNRKEN